MMLTSLTKVLQVLQISLFLIRGESTVNISCQWHWHCTHWQDGKHFNSTNQGAWNTSTRRGKEKSDTQMREPYDVTNLHNVSTNKMIVTHLELCIMWHYINQQQSNTRNGESDISLYRGWWQRVGNRDFASLLLSSLSYRGGFPGHLPVHWGFTCWIALVKQQFSWQFRVKIPCFVMKMN